MILSKFERIFDPSLADPAVLDDLRRLATARVWRLWRYSGVEYEELLSVAMESGLKATRKYDSSRGYPFYHYYASLIRNHVMNYVVDYHTKHTFGVEGSTRLDLGEEEMPDGITPDRQDQREAKDLLDRVEERLSGDVLKFYHLLKKDMNYASASEELGYSRMWGSKKAKLLREIVMDITEGEGY